MSSGPASLGDFNTPLSVWRVAGLSVVVGACAAVVSLVLLDLIGLITHVAYYGQLGLSLVQPTTSHFGAWTVAIPVVGGLIIGGMAYWGSERIRGHGIPEAMETILINGSKMEPRLAILKPISSAISIGSGGPFGAEGPIILTGGAVGSVLSQFVKLTAIERRTLLVAGACAGMAGVFGTPVAATLFGVELLVFEWKPRTVVPIGISVAVAEMIRQALAAHGLIHPAPLFPMASQSSFSTLGVASAVLVGLASASLAWVLTTAVYKFEDLFKKIPVHWALWPAIGGLVIGVGGLVDQRALGVGYASIGDELAGRIAIGGLLLLLVVKLIIWSFSLGSGTSGGILAPLLIIGAALGGIMAPVLPGGSSASWALVGMAATLSGVTRSPFTSVIFAFELTGDSNSLLPLLVAAMVSHLISTVILKRSILTEKVARRGFHVVREYAVEPLEALLVKEVMRKDILTVDSDFNADHLAEVIRSSQRFNGQRIYPVVDEFGSLKGVIAGEDVVGLNHADLEKRVEEIMIQPRVVAYVEETLRSLADRMAEREVAAAPVVEMDSGRRVLRGVITDFDILRSRQRQLLEERYRERVLGANGRRATQLDLELQ